MCWVNFILINTIFYETIIIMTNQFLLENIIRNIVN